MRVISELFDQTTLMVPISRRPLPSGLRPLIGRNLRVYALKEPGGAEFRRKIAFVGWFPRNLPRLWRAVRQADAVHTPVGGDIGTIGILLALTQRKPLFVRHCGTWGEPVSMADRFLHWLLARIAGGRNVVMATGGAATPPSQRNPHISWIFSTSLFENEMESIPSANYWHSGKPLRLVTVGRLEPYKNTEAIIRALALVKKKYPLTSLDVVGDGVCLQDLKRLSSDLNLVDSIAFHGYVSHAEVIEILTKAHLFVFPTLREGFPKAVLEALACGLPVIANAVSVLPRLIGNRNGILLHRTDPEAVAEAILQLIADEKRLAEMSASAQQTAREYTLERWQQVIGERLRASWGPLKEEDKDTDKVKVQTEV